MCTFIISIKEVMFLLRSVCLIVCVAAGPGPPSQRLAQQGPGGCQRPTAIYAVIRDRQGSRSGTPVHLDYAVMMTAQKLLK